MCGNAQPFGASQQELSDMGIRKAILEDIDLLPALEKAAGEIFRTIGMDEIANSDLPTADDYAAYLTHGAIYVTTSDEDETTLTGFILLAPFENAGHIYEVSVHPKFQRQGIGGRLLAQANDWAQASGFNRITLTTFTNVPWNAPYYETKGFKLIEESTYSPAQKILAENEMLHGLTHRCWMHKDLFSPK